MSFQGPNIFVAVLSLVPFDGLHHQSMTKIDKKIHIANIKLNMT